jgi:hypothetical protein
MSTSLDNVIERVRVRRVSGIFRSRRDLEGTVEALELVSFDRADIDLSSSFDGATPKSFGSVEKEPETPQHPVIMTEDIATSSVVVAGILGTICAVGTVSWVVASGGESIEALLAALLVGAAASGVGYLATPYLLGQDRTKSSEGSLQPTDFILSVIVRSPEREEKAQRILRAHNANAIKVHEIEIDRRAADIPLSSLRPDPWLDDRLGQP